MKADAVVACELCSRDTPEEELFDGYNGFGRVCPRCRELLDRNDWQLTDEVKEAAE